MRSRLTISKEDQTERLVSPTNWQRYKQRSFVPLMNVKSDAIESIERCRDTNRAVAVVLWELGRDFVETGCPIGPHDMPVLADTLPGLMGLYMRRTTANHRWKPPWNHLTRQERLLRPDNPDIIDAGIASLLDADGEKPAEWLIWEVNPGHYRSWGPDTTWKDKESGEGTLAEVIRNIRYCSALPLSTP